MVYDVNFRNDWVGMERSQPSRRGCLRKGLALHCCGRGSKHGLKGKRYWNLFNGYIFIEVAYN